MHEWEQETYWQYEKIQDDGKIKTIAANHNDFDGKITGHIVFGVKAWFDENPEERIRLGWTKHIMHGTKQYEYNHQTQYLQKTTKIIDQYTIEDEYKVMDKTEDMMRRAEEDGGWEMDYDFETGVYTI